MSDRLREGTDEAKEPAPYLLSLRTKNMTGGYYWFPTPTNGGVTWSVVNCHELGCEPDDGHDAELWPKIIVRLAEVWSKDTKSLTRRLALSYTGLPRGRVTKPDKIYLILHGADSPDVPAGWENLVTEGFGISGRKVKSVFDEHETKIPGHAQAIENALGSTLYP